MDWYYSGARPYDSEIGRFVCVDPRAGLYPSLSPYSYCANNPLVLIDPTGEVIQIAAGGDTVNYSVGMEYDGDNKQIAQLISTLNSVGGVEIGNTVLSRLIKSKGIYNVAFGGLSNSDAGGQFIGNRNNLGGSLALDSRVLSNVGKIAHEVFHGYQHDVRAGGASIFSEVEAYLFGAGVALSTGEMTMGFGNNTQTGQIYENMMSKVLYAPGFFGVNAHFYSAVSTFKQGSFVNNVGIYNNFNLRSPNNRLLINKFYPLVRF